MTFIKKLFLATTLLTFNKAYATEETVFKKVIYYCTTETCAKATVLATCAFVSNEYRITKLCWLGAAEYCRRKAMANLKIIENGPDAQNDIHNIISGSIANKKKCNQACLKFLGFSAGTLFFSYKFIQTIK